MKKIIGLCFFIALLWSCRVDDAPEEDFHFEILPIATVSVPEVLEGGTVNRINYSYYVPTNCHGFNDLYYIENGNERVIAVVNLVTDSFGSNLPCEPLTDVLDERGFDFTAPPGFQSMIFNFWQGTDEHGEDVYLTIEVPIE